MQTGPAPGQRMRAWLAWTGVVEILNVFLIAGFAWVIARNWEGPAPFTVIGVLSQGLILLEGGLYWLVKRSGAGQRWSPERRVRLLRALYVGTGLALLVFPIALLATAVLAPGVLLPGDVLFGGLLYLFAAGEFVHYFLVKINMRPRELRDNWRRRRLTPARLRRELRRAEAEIRRASPV